MGNIPPQFGYLIHRKIEAGADVRVIVEAVTGGNPKQPALGLIVRVNFVGEPPTLPPEATLEV